MKTHATQTVKDKSDERKDSNEALGSPEDDVEHRFRRYLEEPEFAGSLADSRLRAAVTAACRRGFDRYPSAYPTWKDLEEDFLKRFGTQLSRFEDRATRESLDAMVINLLIEGRFMIQNEYDHQQS